MVIEVCLFVVSWVFLGLTSFRMSYSAMSWTALMMLDWAAIAEVTAGGVEAMEGLGMGLRCRAADRRFPAAIKKDQERLLET